MNDFSVVLKVQCASLGLKIDGQKTKLVGLGISEGA